MSQVEQVVEKIWKPNSGKQELYASLPDSIFEQFYGGQAGGGKSEILMMKPIIKQWINHNRFQGIILRRTFKELEESLIERSLRGGFDVETGTEIPSFKDFGGEYNKGNHKWRFPSGATLTFGHAEEESDIRKYDTAEYQYVAFDELTSFTEFQYKFMAFSRCRSSIPGVPALVCSASNPGNIGHRWVRERFVEPCREGGKIIAERVNIKGVWWCQSSACNFSAIKQISHCPLCSGEIREYKVIKRIFIKAALSDNPKLMRNDPMYRVRMEMLPEAEKRAKAYGDWWTFSGQVFSEFRAERFPDEPSHAYHLTSPQIPDARLPRVLSIDWGKRMMTHGIWGVPLPNKRTLIYREYPPLDSERKPVIGEDVSVWATNMANICLLEGINPYITLDPSAWQDRGTKTIAEQFIDAWKQVTKKSPRIQKADNDRSGGKALVHEYLRWKHRDQIVRDLNVQYDPELAAWIFRNKGLDAHKAYLSQFLPQSPIIKEELPKLLITTDCPILLKTIPLCIYDEKKGDEDIKEFDGDDPYDNLRYYLKKIDTMTVNLTLEDLQEDDKIDDNIFFRKKEIEEAKKKKSACITIGHRRGVRR